MFVMLKVVWIQFSLTSRADKHVWNGTGWVDSLVCNETQHVCVKVLLCSGRTRFVKHSDGCPFRGGRNSDRYICNGLQFAWHRINANPAVGIRAVEFGARALKTFFFSRHQYGILTRTDKISRMKEIAAAARKRLLASNKRGKNRKPDINITPNHTKNIVGNKQGGRSQLRRW